MSEQEWKRLDVIERMEAGKLMVWQAAQVLGLTKRQIRRLRRAYSEGGRAALVHGNKGRAPANRASEELRERVRELYRSKYGGFNDQHFTEKLVEEEALPVSRQTVQRVLREARIGPARKRRPPKHRKRRDRKAQAGLMVLWDGSRHDWLEGRGPVLCLMGAIDDATGELLPGAHFVEQECAAGYLRVLLAIAEKKGLPCSIYMDRHSSLRRNDDHWTLEEELRGEQDPTQVGRALRELGIEPIYALSPQAKGRVERLWGTLQDRLTSELRLAGARTAEEANAVLAKHTPKHNRRFAVAPAESEPAWRPVRRGCDLVRVCAFRYEAPVHNDNTVRLCGLVLDIPPGPSRRSYARSRAEVRQLLDGSWRIYVKGELVGTAPATEVGELRPLAPKKRPAASRAFRRGVEKLGGATA